MRLEAEAAALGAAMRDTAANLDRAMNVADKIRKRVEKSRRQAKKHYDKGDLAKASIEYANCAQQLRYLAGLAPEAKKQDLIDQATRCQEVADGLKKQAIEVPAAEEKPREVDRGEQPTTIRGEGVQEEKKEFVLSEKPAVTFDDIAGMQEVKESIKEAIIYPFVYPEEYRHFGVKPGGGILMYGPPGCGKTMLAAAAAAESDAAFVDLKISDIKNKYVGESERNIKEAFDAAAQYSRAVMFFDEIDALAGERSSSTERYERSLVSELLSQMDGLQSKGIQRNLLVLAASNRPWDIDIALRRSGRFDSTIFIPHPDPEARRGIIELNLREKPLSPDVSVERLAAMMEGYASSEIVDVCQRAARIPLRERIRQKRPRREISMSDFQQVLQRKTTVLTSWYAKALKELSGSEEAYMFEEMMEAARRYLHQP